MQGARSVLTAGWGGEKLWMKGWESRRERERGGGWIYTHTLTILLCLIVGKASSPGQTLCAIRAAPVVYMCVWPQLQEQHRVHDAHHCPPHWRDTRHGEGESVGKDTYGKQNSKSVSSMVIIKNYPYNNKNDNCTHTNWTGAAIFPAQRQGSE